MTRAGPLRRPTGPTAGHPASRDDAATRPDGCDLIAVDLAAKHVAKERGDILAIRRVAADYANVIKLNGHVPSELFRAVIGF